MSTFEFGKYLISGSKKPADAKVELPRNASGIRTCVIKEVRPSRVTRGGQSWAATVRLDDEGGFDQTIMIYSEQMTMIRESGYSYQFGKRQGDPAVQVNIPAAVEIGAGAKLLRVLPVDGYPMVEEAHLKAVRPGDAFYEIGRRLIVDEVIEYDDLMSYLTIRTIEGDVVDIPNAGVRMIWRDLRNTDEYRKELEVQAAINHLFAEG